MGAARDMKPTAGKTRVERRAEQRQLMIWGVLVLVIGLLSFALGFVVGRRSTPEVVKIEQVSAPQPIPPPARPLEALTEAPALLVVPPAEEPLTFYENLSKAETTPLGSGINLPPAAAVQPGGSAGEVNSDPQPAPRKTAPPVKAAGKPQFEQVMADLVQGQPTKKLQLPPVSATGGWVVQLFASKSAADAGGLRDKLTIKNYPVFIAEADLGAKGLWYRVLMGPFTSRDSALQAQAFAEEKDQLKGFTRQR